jgi:Flp pilus assembly protein TadG
MRGTRNIAGRRMRVDDFRGMFSSEGGATAVEFALIAPAFVALLLALFEIGIILFMQEALQTATTQAARLILTGQAQSQNMTKAQFQQQVCNNGGGAFNCANLYVNVQSFASFTSATMFNPVTNGAFDASKLSFSPGAPGSIEVVQVFYEWPVYLGPLGFNLSNMNGNIHLLVATSAFRNEP